MCSRMYYTRYVSDIAPIILVGNEEGLAYLHFDIDKGKREFEIKSDWIKNYDFFMDIINQLDEYLHGKRKDFNIRTNPNGTLYQKKVWQELKRIPYGKLKTYKDIAKKMGNSNSSRAVGNANGKNPLPIIIPCHRVIGANGNLVGYAYGTRIKQKLINIEKEDVDV